MTLVEKMARAIAAGRWDICTPIRQQLFRQQALAALEAMREPTDAMLRAGKDEIDSDYSGQCFTAMIDAAIAEAEQR